MLRLRPLTTWGPFRIDTPPGAKAAERWVSGQLRVLLTAMASVWMEHGGAFQSHLRMAHTVLDAGRNREPTASFGPASTVAFVKQLVLSVSEFLRLSVIPRWENWVTVGQR